MNDNYQIERKPKSRLAELAQRIKSAAAIPGKIIIIPQERFVCQNKFHGKHKTVISFGRFNEFKCDCGIIYQRG